MRLNLTQRGTAYQARRPHECAHDRPASGAWPLTTSGVILGLSPLTSETPAETDRCATHRKEGSRTGQ